MPVELAPGGTLAVRVDSLVRSGGVATLRLIGADGRPWRAFDLATGAAQDAWRVTAGVAEVGGLPPGRWLVRVDSPSGASWEAAAATDAGRETRVTLD